MAASDGQILAAAARWSAEGQYLHELQASENFPTLLKVCKGQYQGLGVPSLPNPGLQTTALVVSAGRCRKILAQPVKLKEGRRVVNIGARLAIPESYPGLFELLSEEGRAVRCMESAVELARKRPKGGVLVRDTVRVIIDGDFPGIKTLTVGETFFIDREVTIQGTKGKYLRCLGSKGDAFLLALDQRGRFSAIAKEDNISGVHSAKNLLRKCLPLTVRLVQGPGPRGMKNQNVTDLRLLSSFEEEHLFALPLQKDTGLIALPMNAPLKVVSLRNSDQVLNMREFQRLLKKCQELVGESIDSIQVLEGKNVDGKLPPKPDLLRRSISSEAALSQRSKVDEYDEIDQIYDYVRGFAPLPLPRPGQPSPQSISSGAPEPPPIETIPSRKISAEKRRSVPKVVDVPMKPPPGKHFVKNASRGTHVLRQKSMSPMKDLPASPIYEKNSSVRYKSLTNLHQVTENNGTLDSSQSGGRTSGESVAGVKLPAEKRSRKLSRPRSLTNLIWELRTQPSQPIGIISSPALRQPLAPMLPPTIVPIVLDKRSRPARLEPGVHRRSSAGKRSTSKRSSGTLYL